MWIRYPIAIAIAYGVFLLLLRLWLRFHGRDWEPDLELELLYAESIPSEESGWEETVVSTTADSSGSSASSGTWFDLDLEEGWLLVLALIVLVGGLIASLYIIYIAPVFLAEILLDGVLLVGLYKKVKHIDQRHWLRTAVRRTVLPALVVAILFSIAGFAMQQAVPEAQSIAEVWRHFG